MNDGSMGANLSIADLMSAGARRSPMSSRTISPPVRPAARSLHQATSPLPFAYSAAASNSTQSEYDPDAAAASTSPFLYFWPSRSAKRDDPAVSVMHTRTSSPSSLDFLDAVSTAVSTTRRMTARPASPSPYPRNPATASCRPVRLTTSETVPRCMYCVLRASIGLRPRRVRSDISFLRCDMASRAGGMSRARRALKYVSSLFDSMARRGRFSETDWRLIDGGEPAAARCDRPALDEAPAASMTRPPSETASASAPA